MSDEQVTISAKELARLRRRRPLAMNLIFLVAVGVASAWMTELHYRGSGGPIAAIGLPTLLVLMGLTIPLGWLDDRRRRADQTPVRAMELMRPFFELLAVLALSLAVAQFAESKLTGTNLIYDLAPVNAVLLFMACLLYSSYTERRPGARRHPGPRYWLVVLACSAVAAVTGLALALTYPTIPLLSPGGIGVLLANVGLVGVLGGLLGWAIARALRRRIMRGGDESRFS